VPEKEVSDQETLAQRFAALYNAASNAGKLWLLDILLYIVNWDIGVATTLLGIPQHEQWRAFEEAVKRVEGFVSHLDDVERAYAVALLYPRLGIRLTSLSDFDRAVELAEKALETLEEVWKAYEKDKALTEERLRPYLELRQVKPDLWKELNSLSQHVYYHAAFVYMDSGELDKAVEYAEKACKFAKELGNVHDEVASCSLPPRLNAVKDGTPSVEEFKKVWEKASQVVRGLSAEAIAALFSNYVVSLVSVGYRGEVEKALEKWGWALELHHDASALTYGVLSLLDERYLEKAMKYFIEWGRASLSKIIDALRNSVNTDLGALTREMWRSSMLYLSALVGLAYCKRGKGWGLELAKATVWVGSQLLKGFGSRLFGELYKALEGATVGNCVTDEVLRAVYKLYYYHV